MRVPVLIPYKGVLSDADSAYISGNSFFCNRPLYCWVRYNQTCTVLLDLAQNLIYLPHRSKIDIFSQYLGSIINQSSRWNLWWDEAILSILSYLKMAPKLVFRIILKFSNTNQTLVLSGPLEQLNTIPLNIDLTYSFRYH